MIGHGKIFMIWCETNLPETFKNDLWFTYPFGNRSQSALQLPACPCQAGCFLLPVAERLVEQ